MSDQPPPPDPGTPPQPTPPSPPPQGGYGSSPYGTPPPPGGYGTSPSYGPPPPRKRRTSLVVVLSAIGVLVVGLMVVRIVTQLPEDAGRSESGRINQAGDLDAFDIQVGDCFNQTPTGQAVHGVQGVPCGQPHDAEVYASFELTADSFPGKKPLTRQARSGCVDRFHDFVGIPYRDSKLDFYYLHPTKRSWELRDDREVICAVIDPKGKLTEPTLEGAKH